MYRRRVIARCFLSLVAAVGMLGVLSGTQSKFAWLGWAVVPAGFLPSVAIAAMLAQRLDKDSHEAFWIGVPTIASIGLMVGFAFFMFSPLGEQWLAVPTLAVLAVVLIAGFAAGTFLLATRLLRRCRPRVTIGGEVK